MRSANLIYCRIRIKRINELEKTHIVLERSPEGWILGAVFSFQTEKEAYYVLTGSVIS